jgi:[acyl-carrier-protein] S-malonyltransferase
MAAVLGLEDEKVESICMLYRMKQVKLWWPLISTAGQLVISGSVKGIEIACERMKAAGAKRAMILPVGGASTPL